MARIVAVTDDLLFGSRIEQTLSAAGHDVSLAREVDPDADLLIVDLAGQEDMRVLADVGPPVLGYYSHVDPAPRDAALELGVSVAVPRSKLVREMDDLVSSLLEPQGD